MTLTILQYCVYMTRPTGIVTVMPHPRPHHPHESYMSAYGVLYEPSSLYFGIQCKRNHQYLFVRNGLSCLICSGLSSEVCGLLAIPTAPPCERCFEKRKGKSSPHKRMEGSLTLLFISLILILLFTVKVYCPSSLQ